MVQEPRRPNVMGKPEDEARIETHCYLCQQELPEGPALISSKCGVNFHDECAKRAVKCPACGENLLEHFLNEKAKDKIKARDRLFTIILFVVPFVIIELLIAVWSIINHPSKWTIPPWFGEAFILDLIVLIVGIIIAVIIFAKLGYKPEKRAINALVITQKGPTPGEPEEQLYTCGYGDRARPFLLGDVSVPNKVGVQREGVVRVAVDRLVMTPDGTYVWINPRFQKLIPSSKNPQPSSPEEMEQVWKASGRSKLAGEEMPPSEEELPSPEEEPLPPP